MNLQGEPGEIAWDFAGRAVSPRANVNDWSEERLTALFVAWFWFIQGDAPGKKVSWEHDATFHGNMGVLVFVSIWQGRVAAEDGKDLCASSTTRSSSLMRAKSRLKSGILKNSPPQILRLVQCSLQEGRQPFPNAAEFHITSDDL